MKKPLSLILIACILVGFGVFLIGLAGGHPERYWQAFLINFLLWSGVAQGGVLFSAVMHTTKARWSGPLARLSESFAAFFPISFVLFLLLFLGKNHIFPWLHEDLHGKEVWLNLPFLFSRNLLGLILLYGAGFAYLFNSLGYELHRTPGEGKIRGRLHRWWTRTAGGAEGYRSRMSLFGILYILFFVLILSLIGYDLVMSMDPHWYSTLFGAYTFVKAFYTGLGGLIILAAVLHLKQGPASGLTASHFHDLGKLFFAFCLMWADFFYVQFAVIWYGNISEETSYLIERTVTAPWGTLAWTVFIIAFAVPFVVLLNKRVKSLPAVMIPLCALTLVGIWLEHLLLVGPAFHHHAESLPLHLGDGLITLAFPAMMIFAVVYYMGLFPEIYRAKDSI